MFRWSGSGVRQIFVELGDGVGDPDVVVGLGFGDGRGDVDDAAVVLLAELVRVP